MFTGRAGGVIPLIGGLIGCLIFYRVIQVKTKDADRLEAHHRRYGTMMKVISPLLVVYGLVWILGGLDH